MSLYSLLHEDIRLCLKQAMIKVDGDDSLPVLNDRVLGIDGMALLRFAIGHAEMTLLCHALRIRRACARRTTSGDKAAQTQRRGLMRGVTRLHSDLSTPFRLSRPQWMV